MASTSRPSLVLTGATGTVGLALVRALSRRGVAFRAMVRAPDKATALAALPGAELVAGDFDDAASLARALDGAERAFLLTPSTERAEAQQRAFVAAARRAGVRHVVKLSQWAADAGSPVRFLRYHAVVEAALRDAGLATTSLRPNLFMQGLLAFASTIASQGQFFAPAGEAKISLIDARDIAAVAAIALTEPGHDGKTYDLTGPEALSHAEIAAQLAAALARPVRYVDVPPAAMRGALDQMAMPAWQADGLIEDYAHYARGEAAVVTSCVQDVTGHAPRTFAQFARDHAAAFA